MKDKFRTLLILILFFSIATKIYNLTHINNVKFINTNMTFYNMPLIYIYNFIYNIGTLLIYLSGYKKQILIILGISILKLIFINQSWFNLFAIIDSTICIFILSMILIDVFKKKLYQLKTV